MFEYLTVILNLVLGDFLQFSMQLNPTQAAKALPFAVIEANKENKIIYG